MKRFLSRLAAGLFASLAVALGLSPALLAQNVALTEPLVTLVRPTNGLVGLGPTGALLRSTNNGVSFSTVRAADNPRALYTLAASGSTVVAMGDAANFVRSTDDGATWTTLASALNPAHGGPINALAANGTTWIAVGERGQNISALRSTNSGATWASATIPAVYGTLHGVAWTGSRWVAVGGNGITGFIYTSTDGASWTLLSSPSVELYAVASNGSGQVVAVGDAGTILHATDGAATSTSFATIGDLGANAGVNIVSDALRAVAFLSGDSWVIGGDNLVRVSFNSSTQIPSVASAPSATATAAYTAFVSTGTGANYYYAPDEAVPPALEPQGPISLQIANLGANLQLTLVGAQNGYTYHVQSSTTLSSWSAVSGSTVTFTTGNSAPTWTYPAPSAGGRVFYRVAVGAP